MDIHDFLWAKINPLESIFSHSLKVAFASQVLLKNSSISPILNELQDNLGLSENDTLNLVGYLTSLHDIGKIHPCFIGNGAYPEAYEYLKSIGKSYSIQDNFRHEWYGAKRLTAIWKENNRLPNNVIDDFSIIIKHHHQGKKGTTGSLPLRLQSFWYPLQEEFENIIYNYFLPPANFNVKNMNAFCFCVLGLLFDADWLASNEYFINISFNEKELDKIDLNRNNFIKQINLFLVDNYLDNFDIFKNDYSFSQLFNFIPVSKMRPLQVEIENIFKDSNNKALGILIEAPMGEGKTEAALYAATKLCKLWNKTGIYVSLPTTATSNQMYSRVKRFLEPFNSPYLKLIHSLSWFVDDADDNVINSNDFTYAQLWTASKRKGLLSHFAVGTIDQAMLGAMRCKYNFLRLVGLASKVLIIDEIHSYDAYMNKIIYALLCWCRVMHIPVIILSATLTSEKRNDIAKCFSLNDFHLKNQYPSITLFYENNNPVQIPVLSSSKNLVFNLVKKPWIFNNKLLSDFIYDKMNAFGGCYCIIRNTVKSAQETYLALKNRFQGCNDVEIILFHSQFPVFRRMEIENQCLSYFGKNGNRPKKAILVATQVVEQSLDLDFDFMVSDIAPMDLLLQRLGREFRHAETIRPIGMQPEFLVLISENNDFGNSGYVYNIAVLNSTLNILSNRDTINIPDDINLLVEQTYSSIDFSTESGIEFRLKSDLMESVGDNVILSPNQNRFCLNASDLIFENDDESLEFNSATRMGNNSIRISFVDESLFNRLNDDIKPSIDIAKQVLLNSLSVSYHKVAFLEKCPSNIVKKPLGLLYGLYVLKSSNFVFTFENNEISCDYELGFLKRRLK